MTAGCVAVAGVIGFVGLVVPHVLRMLLGSAHGPLLYGAFLGGGILLVWADVLARCVLSGGQEFRGCGDGPAGRPLFRFSGAEALMLRAKDPGNTWHARTRYCMVWTSTSIPVRP